MSKRNNFLTYSTLEKELGEPIYNEVPNHVDVALYMTRLIICIAIDCIMKLWRKSTRLLNVCSDYTINAYETKHMYVVLYSMLTLHNHNFLIKNHPTVVVILLLKNCHYCYIHFRHFRHLLHSRVP